MRKRERAKDGVDCVKRCFELSLFSKYFYSDKNKDDVIDKTCSTFGGDRQNFLVEKPENINLTGRPRCRRESNIKTGFKEK